MVEYPVTTKYRRAYCNFDSLGEASIDTGDGIGLIKNLFLPKLRAALAELVTVIALLYVTYEFGVKNLIKKK